MSTHPTSRLVDFDHWPSALDVISAQKPQTGIIHWTVPINALANELLCRIFHLGREETEKPWISDHEGHFEILISTVCKHWRSISIGDPLLWTTVRMKSSLPVSLARVTLYLARSKAAPLSIIIEYKLPLYQDDALQRSNCRRILELGMKLILPHVKRFQSLDVSADRGWPMGYILAHLWHLYAPILRTLRIYYSRNAYQNQDDSTLSAIGTIFVKGAPLLTDIQVIGLGFRIFSPPLAAVTNLLLDECMDARGLLSDYHMLHKALSSATSLKSLRLLGCNLRNNLFLSDLPIHMPSLVTMELSLGSNYAAYHLLARVKVPSLKLLHLRFYDPYQENLADEYLGGLVEPWQSDFSALEELRLTSAEIYDGRTYAKLSRAMPTVGKMIIAGTSSNSFEILFDLAAMLRHYPDHAISCWPKLCSIAILNGVAVDAKIFIPLVAAREKSTSPIREITCKLDPSQKCSAAKTRLGQNVVVTDLF